MPTLPTRVAIALVSTAIILFEILITRLLSVTLSYHFAFLAISLAMLGLTAPAIWMALRPPTMRTLQLSLLLGALSFPASIAAIVHLGAPLRSTPGIWVFFLLGPMLMLGSAICQILLNADGREVAKLYAADLGGAALGAILAVPLLSGLPTPSVLAALGLLPLIAYLLLFPSRKLPALLLAAGLFGTIVWGKPYLLRYTRFNVEESAPLFEKWTPTARITVNPYGGLKGWGIGSKWNGPKSEALWIDQDGSAGTAILKHKPGEKPPEQLLYEVTSAQYELGLGTRACIIGGGGGKDILSAFATGVREVEVVELNPWTVQAVSENFASYSGNPYHLPGVETFVGEGRSHFARPGRPCDVLQISQIDTFAASSAGAYALTENSLYTVEAIQTFWGRLSEGGALSISRWADGPAWPESVRLVLLINEALALLGIEDPRAHMLVLAAGGSANVMVFRRPLTPELIERADAISGARGFERWWPPMAPGPSGPPPVTVALLGGGPEIEAMGYDLSPTTDDRPFFFQTLSLLNGTREVAERGTGERERSVTLLRDLALTLTVVTLSLLLLPLVLSRKLPRPPNPIRTTLYFSLIGIGFMFVEIPLVQRLALYLGHPSYSTTVVLGSLLLGAGAGSSIVPKIPEDRRRTTALLVPVLVACLAFALVLFIVPTTQSFELWTRITIAAGSLFALGVPMGILLPLGMSALEGKNRSWVWAVNGASGVLASVLALVFALLGGFTLVLGLSVALYALAACCYAPGNSPA